MFIRLICLRQIFPSRGETISNAEDAQREQIAYLSAAGCAPQTPPKGDLCPTQRNGELAPWPSPPPAGGRLHEAKPRRGSGEGETSAFEMVPPRDGKICRRQINLSNNNLSPHIFYVFSAVLHTTVTILCYNVDYDIMRTSHLYTNSEQRKDIQYVSSQQQKRSSGKQRQRI